MSIIICDGPRGVGKSRLVELIDKECQRKGLQTNIFKGERGEDPFEQMENALRNFESHPHTVHICDRFLLTEIVFSIYHRRSPMERLYRGFQQINSRLRPPDVLHFLLIASPEVLELRLTERPEGRRTDMPFELVNPIWRMAALMAMPHLKLRYNETDFHLDGIVQEIMLSERMQNLIALREGNWI